MRHCVLRHHVCLCVLSTAMLAGLALLIDPKKGYAAPKNCEAVTRGGGDDKWRIECDGVGTRTVAGNRDINMGEVVRGRWGTVDNSGEPAVKVYNKANIRITGDVTITGDGSNKNPAIQVYQQGVLTVNNVTMKDVYKGIEADSKGSVTVIEGKIEVRADGVSVIEVKGGGSVTLMNEVKVNGGGGNSTGIEVGDGGGNVTVMTKNFTGVNKGIVFTGNMGRGQAANVTGVGAGTMMTVERDGVGITMEGAGTASVMSMKIMATRGGGKTGVDMKNGELTLMNVEMKGFDKGMNMTGGTLEVNGRSRIEGTTMGVNMTSAGILTVNGSTIMVTGSGSTGVGLKVEGDGTVTVTGKSTIMASGGSGGATGVLMEGSKTVELSGVTVSNFATGISVQNGTVTVNGESKITGKSMGVEVKGGTFVAAMSKGGKIEVQAGGTGLKVTGAGIANVMNAMITTSGRSETGVEAGGKEVTLTGVKIEKFETGISVTSGEVTVNGDSTIQGVETGVSVTKGRFVMGGAGGGSMIAVTEHNGVGLKVTEQGTANVMNAMIMANGSGVTGSGRIGVESSGTVTLNMVGVMGFDKGISVTSGKVKVMGGEINGKSMGVEVKDGEFEMEGTESGIVVDAGGTGLKVMDGGSASVMNTTIMASGSGGTGVEVSTSGGKGVTLDGVKIEKFEKGVVMEKGTFKMMGGMITTSGSGVTGVVGVYATGGDVTLEGGVEISGFTTGVSVEGGGNLTMTRGSITGNGGSGTGVEVNTLGGKGVMLDGVKIEKFEKGISVTSGKLTVNGGSIKGENKGYGVYALGGEVMMTEVKISQVGAGVYMTGDGTLTIKKGTEIELASGGEYGVYVGKDVKSASLNDVKIIGGGSGTGVYALGGEVTLEGVVKISQVETGVYMMGDGTLTMTGGTEIELASGGEYGVYVGRDVKSASLNDVKIIGGGLGSRYGVYARGEVVMISGGAIKEVEEGIVMLGKGTLEVKKGTTISFVGSGTGVSVGREVTRATLNDVTITGQNKGTGVYALGAETMTMTLTGVKISNVTTGVEVMRGMLKIEKGTTIEGVQMGVVMKSGESLMISGNSTISFTGDYGVGVIVGDGVTRASLDNVIITGQNRGNGVGGTGIHAMGKMMMISGGEISQVKTGVHMEGKGTLTMTGGKMTNVQTGVYMTGGELTMNKGTTISLARKSEYGVYVGRNVTRADLNNVTITGKGLGSRYGVYAVGTMAKNGALTMELAGVKIDGVMTGVSVKSGKSLMISGNSTISVVGSGTGVYAMGMGEMVMTLDKVEITGGGMASTGVEVWGGKEVTLTNVGISEVGKGVTMRGGEKLTISGERSVISFTGKDGYGVYVEGMKEVTLNDMRIKGENRGYGVYAKGTEEMVLTEVRIEGVKAGVYAEKGMLTMERGTRIELADGGRYGVYVGSGVTRADLDDVMIKGGGSGSEYGVYAVGKGMVTMQKVRIEDVEKGVSMISGNSLTINGNSTISFVGDYGVYVGALVTRATLNDVTITGNGSGGIGVHAMGAGNGALTMTLDKVRISEVGAGVVMGKGKSLTISGGSIAKVKTGVMMMSGESLTVERGTTIEFTGSYGYGVMVGIDVTSANLDDVTIRGNGTGGMGVYAEGKRYGELTMELTNVKISEVETGVVMVEGKSLTISGESSAISFAGDDGVGVGVGEGVARASLNDLTIMGGGSGKGVVAMGGEVTVDKVRIEEIEAGVVMEGDGTLTMTGGTTIELARGGKYGVYVEGGVSASLIETVIKGGGKGSMGVYAEGKDVTLTLTDVDISQVGMGITMKGDGTLTVMEDSTINFMESGYGVMVGGEVTAELIGTTIKGENRGSGTGVIMESSGKMMLEDVDIKGVKTGVYAEKGELEIKGKTEIEFAEKGWGVYVKGDVKSASLTKTVITGKGGDNSYGVYVVGGTTGYGTLTMTLDEVTISQVGEGVRMMGGESLTVMGGSIKGVTMGINMTGSGTLIMQDKTRIEFKENGWGIYVGKEVSASLMGTVITGMGSGTGVHAEGGETVALDEVTIKEVETGVKMRGGKSLTINGERSVISFVGEYGVYVKNTAMVELTKTRIVGQKNERGGNNGVKYGVYATGGDVTMTLNDVRIEEVKTGITMLGGGLKVSGGSITKVETGIAMSGSGTLMVEKGTEIQFTKGYGVMVGERVTANLMGTTIKGEGKGSTGVYVAGGKALLEQVKIEGSNQATGLYVTQGAVRLQNTTLRDVAMGMTISQGVVMMEGGSIEFTDRYGISVSGGQAVLSGFKIIKKGNEDTDKSTGVWVDNSGKVMMRGVDISGVQMGAYVMETGLLVMDKGSIDFKGEYGIYTSLQNSP